MTPRAFLVVGPQSSGTRLATRLLIAAGCTGDGGHEQRFDDPEKLAAARGAAAIVWRRSYPHADEWPSLRNLCRAVEGLGFEPAVIVMARRQSVVIQSQLRTFRNVPTADVARADIARAYASIYAELPAGVPVEVVTYESLTAPGGATDFVESLGLWWREQPEHIYDGNARYS